MYVVSIFTIVAYFLCRLNLSCLAQLASFRHHECTYAFVYDTLRLYDYSCMRLYVCLCLCVPVYACVCVQVDCIPLRFPSLSSTSRHSRQAFHTLVGLSSLPCCRQQKQPANTLTHYPQQVQFNAFAPMRPPSVPPNASLMRVEDVSLSFSRSAPRAKHDLGHCSMTTRSCAHPRSIVYLFLPGFVFARKNNNSRTRSALSFVQI